MHITDYPYEDSYLYDPISKHALYLREEEICRYIDRRRKQQRISRAKIEKLLHVIQASLLTNAIEPTLFDCLKDTFQTNSPFHVRRLHAWEKGLKTLLSKSTYSYFTIQ